MSSWLVYWLMMADSIKNFLFIGGALLMCFCVLAAVATAINSVDVNDNDIEQKTKDYRLWLGAKTLRNRALAFAFPLLALAVFTPSTKTIAMMIVLPKITSPQALDAMGSEAKDLYLIAKKALTELAEPAKKKEDEK